MSNIARLRKIRGLTQTDLAEMVAVTQPHISRIESGDEGPPLSLYRQIADALGVSLSDLFAEDRTRQEVELLDTFRSLPPQRQKLWLRMAMVALTEDPTAGPETNQIENPSSGK